jgi:small ligand-binding sensory domain FIST
MRCAAAASTQARPESAVRQVMEELARQFGPDDPADLAMVFASPGLADALGPAADELHSRQLARHVLGTTGESIVAVDREIEGGPALVVWAARLPDGAGVHALRLTGRPDAAQLRSVQDRLGTPATLILLADPFAFATDRWLEMLRAEAPGWTVVGGMASAGLEPGSNRLVLDGETCEHGAVALLVDGPVGLRTVVSQGCRPIGEPMVITKADRNRIQQLGGVAALTRLQRTYEALDPEEQEMVRNGLHLGRVVNEYQERFGLGDFLIRNVMGVDESGAVAVGDLVRVGQTVQFHVRDSATADADLREMLAAAMGSGASRRKVAGALLFSCNGRGSRLFEEPDHDVTAIREATGPIPVAGFFAMGEVGPVGGHSFVHGYTASILLFEES